MPDTTPDATAGVPAQLDNDQIQARRKKLDQIANLQKMAYPNGVPPPEPVGPISKTYAAASEEVLTQKPKRVCVAGRVMFLRDFGKGAFWKCRDHTGSLQLFISKKELDDKNFELAKLVDLGDMVWVEGVLFRTQKGELTVKVHKLVVLAKCLRPLPEKYHGLTDVELRYRKRYLDLIMSETSYDTFLKRSVLVSHTRRFLESREFLEVETPMMQAIPSGALARPFQTHHNTLDKDLYLRVAPELYLKRLVVGGYPRVFELNRNFRNEGISTEHNPEFTMLEVYQAYATFEDMMALIETLFAELCQKLHGSTAVTYGTYALQLKAPFQRLHMFQALAEKLKVSVDSLFDRKAMEKVAKQQGIQVQKYQTGAEITVNVFEHLFEPIMQQPVFVVGFPVEVSPLARRQESDPRFTDRFELFVAGKELANGFSELNDPEDQLARFEEQQRARESGHEEALLIDHDYVEALSYGMPPTAGAGIGIDRLAMILLNQPSIRDVILFPTLR